MEGLPTAATAHFPQVRMRRLRRGSTLRRMVRETRLSPDRLVLPLFVIEGRDARVPIPSLPGHARLSPDLAAAAARRAFDAGIPALLLFGVTDHKDGAASAAYETGGVVQTAVAAIKDAVPEMVVITDVCLCGYTDHGHCGALIDGRVHNDLSLELLARTAVSHAEAGADIVAPSDMMDGRVGAIRSALDGEGHEETAILAYSAKYASALYGPFREAAGSAPGFGDRRGYQMDPANGREAVRETISGEYSMLKAAAERGWLDERLAAMEVLTGIARAGADLLITYYAEDAARWLSTEAA